MSVLIVEQFVTHALAVASRAYVLEKGEVAFSGKAAELARDEAFVKGSYLGEGGIDAADVNGATELRFDDDRRSAPARRRPAADDRGPGGA